MSTPDTVTIAATHYVRDRCLCLHTQRAARVLARRFDTALRPYGMTNAQFSLLMTLNRPRPQTLGEISSLLGADRTTLTAALKTLARRGLVEVKEDASDRRAREISLTPEGHVSLVRAYPAWEASHADLERDLEAVNADQLRRDLDAISFRRTP